MLDPDISTQQALAHLSRDEHDPNVLDRRRFLQLVGMGLGAGVLAGPTSSLLDTVLGQNPGAAFAAGPVGANDGILIVLGMFGGNDGLNTTVPFNDSNYYEQHGSLAVPANQTLSIDGDIGLNPALTEFKRFWDDGKLAIVEGVGYPNPDLSHFNSMGYWMAGRPNAIPTSGWLGRWLDGYLGSQQDLYAGVEVGHSLPLHLVGLQHRGTVVPPGKPAFGAGTDERDLLTYEAVRNMRTSSNGDWHRNVSQAFVDQLDLAARLAPVIPETLPEPDIVASLEVIARLVNANLGFRVLTVGFGDFDSHAGQPSQHSQRMTELNAAVARFFQVLSPSFATRVTVMTFSEFGRTSWDNDGNGTDHGTSAPHFVFGENVKGGRYGQRPSMAGLRRWDRMAHHVDFRSYYGSVIDGWLGGGSSDVLGGNFENLGLFSRGPGVVNPVGSPDGGASKSPGTFVPMNPKRFADTRDGTGGVPRRRMAPKEFIKVHVADRSGVPADAIAVVANVTAATVSEPTFFTVCPGGARKPETSNLNPRPGSATPNLVIMGIGADGCVDVHNDVGSSDCIVDVFGYFRAGSTADRYRSLTPRRLLDTRDGTGAPAGKRGRGHRLELKVTDLHGVPSSGVSAVVLNVTVVDPGSDGYLTVGPAGASKPETSNVNFGRRQTVPNLVICKVGTGGNVNIWIEGDAVDVLADVFGYFGGSGSLLRTVVPSRVLDSRAGLGAARSLVPAGGRIDVQVASKAGVPSNATAVVLNVTATDVAAGSFVTVWPTDVSMPDTSNLNIEPGDSVANLVISKLSTDGKVSLANARGTTNLIADVLGYFVD